MSYDMDMCTGRRDNTASICPLRDKCKRYILGKKAMDEHYYPVWWTQPNYVNKECEYFIEIKKGCEK